MGKKKPNKSKSFSQKSHETFAKCNKNLSDVGDQPSIPQAEALLRAGRISEATELLQNCLHPQHRTLLEQWSRHFMKEGRFDSAASLFQLVTQLCPQDDKAYNALAVAWSMAGKQNEALAAMKRCVELAPDSWRHRFNLGKLYMLREEWEKAKSELEEASGGATGQQATQIQEYLAICQDKIDFPVVDLAGNNRQDCHVVKPDQAPPPAVTAATQMAPEPRESATSSSKRFNTLQPLPVSPIGRTDNPLNILFVQEAPCIRNYKMACALRKRGHRVSLAYTKARLSQMYPGLSDDSYDECIPLRSNLQLWEISRNYDLIHCHNEPDLPTVVAMSGDAPVIHDTHDLISLRANGDPNLVFFEGLANRGAAGRVYVSPYLLTEVQTLYKVKGPSLVFGNYVSQPDIPSKYHSKLSADDGKVHLVYEGGIGLAGHRNFSSIFIELARKGLQVHIYPSHFNQEVADLFSAHPNIYYNQPLNPKLIIEEMTRYDVGIIPFNIQEGNRRFLNTSLANKLYEYLAAGLPVVASDLVSYNDFFAEYPVGFTFKSTDDIIDGLDRLREISSSIDVRQYCKTYEGDIHKMEDFYLKVLEQGSNLKPRPEAGPAPWQTVEAKMGGAKLTFSM